MLHLITCHGRIMPRLVELLLQIYKRVMALGYSQHYISAQNLVNELMDFDQILHMH